MYNISNIRTLILKFCFITFLCVFIMDVSGQNVVGIIIKKKSVYCEKILSELQSLLPDENYKSKVIEFENASENLTPDLIKKSNCQYLICVGDETISSAIESDLPGVFIFVKQTKLLGLIDNKNNHITKLAGISSYIAPEEIYKILKYVHKKKNKVWILYNPLHLNSYISSNIEHGMKSQFSVFEEVISNRAEVMPFLHNKRKKMDFLLGVPDITVINSITLPNILRFVIMNKICFISLSEKIKGNGVLINIFPDYKQLAFNIIASLKQIINGTEARTLEHKYIQAVNFSINEKTFKLLKIPINDYLAENAIRPVKSDVSVLVIINKENPINSLTKAELKSIYLKKTNRWRDSKKIHFIDQKTDDAHDLFVSKYIHKTRVEIERFWIKQKFKGKRPHKSVITCADVKVSVSGDPYAIGYLHAEEYDDTVKILRITE